MRSVPRILAILCLVGSGAAEVMGIFFSVQPVVTSWAQLQTPGFVDGVTFRNIVFTGNHACSLVVVKGYDATHTTKNVTFDHVMVNGALLTQTTPGVTVGSYSSNIRFIDSGVTGVHERQGRTPHAPGATPRQGSRSGAIVTLAGRCLRHSGADDRTAPGRMNVAVRSGGD